MPPSTPLPPGSGDPRPAGLESPFVFEGRDGNFAELVLANSRRGPVLVNFWSRRAGPSLRQYPLLERLVHEFEGRFLLVNLDAERHRALAREHGVVSVPVLQLFRGGVAVQTLRGYRDEGELRAFLARHTGRDVEAALAGALRDHERNPERALRRLADLALDAPEDLRVPATIAKLLMRERRYPEAAALLGALPAPQRRVDGIRRLLTHAELLAEAERAAARRGELEAERAAGEARPETCFPLAALRVVEDDYAGAMALLHEIMRRDRGFRDGLGRRALLTLCELLGPGHALSRRYRPVIDAPDP